MNFYEDLKKIMNMEELKYVAWKQEGDDKICPQQKRTFVRFEDVKGKVFDLLIHPNMKDSLIQGLRNEEEVILNVAFSYFGIVPKGHWIGMNTGLEDMVNLCRNKAKYEGKFFVNKDIYIWSKENIHKEGFCLFPVYVW